MSFMDNFSAVKGIAANKAKNLAYSAKTSAAIENEKHKLDRAYRDLGEMYYKKYLDQTDPEFQDVVSRIQASEEVIDNERTKKREHDDQSEKEMEMIRSDLQKNLEKKHAAEDPMDFDAGVQTQTDTQRSPETAAPAESVNKEAQKEEAAAPAEPEAEKSNTGRRILDI